MELFCGGLLGVAQTGLRLANNLLPLGFIHFSIPFKFHRLRLITFTAGQWYMNLFCSVKCLSQRTADISWINRKVSKKVYFVKSVYLTLILPLDLRAAADNMASENSASRQALHHLLC